MLNFNAISFMGTKMGPIFGYNVTWLGCFGNSELLQHWTCTGHGIWSISGVREILAVMRFSGSTPGYHIILRARSAPTCVEK
mmetsp:Transcript_37688/g.80516  ORF Transcript_37688/g.80516 Transcript_37688/m.80516 type:complete len:82 (-) Transcript_37688:1926-2171(-)